MVRDKSHEILIVKVNDQFCEQVSDETVSKTSSQTRFPRSWRSGNLHVKTQSEAVQRSDLRQVSSKKNGSSGLRSTGSHLVRIYLTFVLYSKRQHANFAKDGRLTYECVGETTEAALKWKWKSFCISVDVWVVSRRTSASSKGNVGRYMIHLTVDSFV